MDLIFQAGNKNGLHKSFHVDPMQKLNPGNPRVATRSLLIACDRLEIHGELRLPECDVTIYARELTFGPKGRINTTPLAWQTAKAKDANPTAKTKADDGAHGRHGGKIDVYISKLTTPPRESIKRFVTNGGNGQHAGFGLKGTDGKRMYGYTSRKYRVTDSGIKTTYCNAKFDPPAVYIEYEWWWGLNSWASGKDGTNAVPTNGTDALAPGKPGEPGNASAVTTNVNAVAALAESTGGRAGNSARNVSGGRAGTPTESKHYKLKLWHHWFNKYGNIDYSSSRHTKTKGGRSYTAQRPKNMAGKSPAPKFSAGQNWWLHPLQIQAVLRYLRDAFLGNNRESVRQYLEWYNAALSAKMPKSGQPGKVWQNAGTAKWFGAHSDVAAMRQKILTQLDYFGNPAGYMPLLSLQSNMRLYEIETGRALRTLLLEHWVTDRKNEAQSATSAISDTISTLNSDTTQVAKNVADAEDKVRGAAGRLDVLRGRLNKMANKLGRLESKLYTQTSQDLHLKAQIKAAVKMAAAITQVIPVGQPVLGTVGKLGAFAADLPDGNVVDTTSKMGKAIDKTKKAMDKAAEAAEKAKKKGKEVKDPSKLSVVGDGLGDAVSLAGEAIGALQVPESEIEAELEKLKAQSPEWEELTGEIQILNQDKTELFADLLSALQVVTEGYARLVENAESLQTLQKERQKTLARLDVEAVQAISGLGQRARISLQKSLYLMVRSYEATVLRSVSVNWQMDKVFSKISELLKPATGFDAATVNQMVKSLKPIFEDNQNVLKRQLLENYGFDKEVGVELEFGLTKGQTPKQLKCLNKTSTLTLDPVEYGLILPDKQRITLANLALTAIEFDEKGPALPASGNAIISIESDQDGSMRRSREFYATRSNNPRPWSWTYHFSDNKVSASKPSTSSLDLLNTILSDAGSASNASGETVSIKQKLAEMPLWSKLRMRLSFSPELPLPKRPRIKELIFRATASTWTAPNDQKVLDVRCAGAVASISCSKDLGDRGDGFGNLYRIYGNRAEVTLKAPAENESFAFSHWEISNNEEFRKFKKPNCKLTMTSHTVVKCYYVDSFRPAPEVLKEAQVISLSTLTSTRNIDRAMAEAGSTRVVSAIAKVGKPFTAQKAKVRKVRARPKAALAATREAPEQSRILHIKPEGRSAVVDIIPAHVHPTVLVATQKGWEKVQSGGVIGYRRI
ncbi:MAG: hypothetical protein PVI42_01860 [Desulfobacterales bacterium]|jgi:hypothetical protein